VRPSWSEGGGGKGQESILRQLTAGGKRKEGTWRGISGGGCLGTKITAEKVEGV